MAATTAAVSVASNGTWVTAATANGTNGGNLTDGAQYYALAAETSPAGSSAVVAFNAEKTTNATATVTTPSSATCYYNATSSQCTTTPKANWPGALAGTGTDSGGQTLAGIQVAVENPGGLWWNGSSFASSVPVYGTAGGTPGSWSFPLSATQLGSTTGTFTVVVSATDTNGMTNIGSPVTFTWKD